MARQQTLQLSQEFPGHNSVIIIIGTCPVNVSSILNCGHSLGMTDISKAQNCVLFQLVTKMPWMFQQGLLLIYIKVHLRMRTCSGHLHAKCKFPIIMHKEGSDRKSGRSDFGLRSCDFSNYNKVVKNLKDVSCCIHN